jgi:hypothetical protein
MVLMKHLWHIIIAWNPSILARRVGTSMNINKKTVKNQYKFFSALPYVTFLTSKEDGNLHLRTYNTYKLTLKVHLLLSICLFDGNNIPIDS